MAAAFSSVLARPRRRWLWPGVLAASISLGVGVLVGKFVLTERELDCKTASRTVSDSVAVGICQREYERTKLPLTGAYVADLLRRSDNTDGAKALANTLLSTEAKGDALQILGKIAEMEGRVDDAVKLLQEARQAHRAQGNHVELARDAQALGRIQADSLQQYADALQTIEECISEARAGSDALIEGYCHLSAALALMAAGYFDAAQQEIDRAEPQMATDRDRAQLWYVRGDLHQEVDREPLRRTQRDLAIGAFEQSLAFAKRAGYTTILPTLYMNLAYSLAEVGRTDEADRHLAQAALLDPEGRDELPRSQLAARIAYRRGNYPVAMSINERLYPILDEEQKIDVSVMQARMALTLNDRATARLWAQRGIDNVEAIRAKQPVTELRPWVLASRREPFEVLFSVHARAGNVEEAIVTFDQWQGRTLLDVMARPSLDPSPQLSTTAMKIQRLGQWLPAVSKAPLMMSDARAVTQTLRKIDLIALAVADGEVWRLTASRGKLRLDALGEVDALQDRFDRFIATPTDPAAADELGALILPSDLVRSTTDPLYVVLDAPLAALPFVALRVGGQPLIATRPVVRSPRLPIGGACGTRADIGRALILADAAGDLPNARLESSKVASLFQTTPLVGAAATSTALLAAESDLLLHVAVHAEVDSGGGVLKLHDRAVSAPEISANKVGPVLVVLSGCSTANSADPELAGSLSTAFLAAGSQRVVATLRPVTDAGALELTSRFYSQHGTRDPVRVLAKIQAELSRGANKEWPSFAVFGSDACVAPR